MDKKFINDINNGNTYLGIELGSTVIKSILISSDYEIIGTGSFAWQNRLEDNLWTYHLEDAIKGLQSSYLSLKSYIKDEYNLTLTSVKSIGISAMMHGIIALDKNDKQITPFLTWRNTNTSEAAKKLSELFNFNVPMRWTISQAYQAHLDNKEYLKDVNFITTLAGYIHYVLTGKKVIGIDDASGMFPIDSNTLTYDKVMLEKYNNLVNTYSYKIEEVLPEVLVAGCDAGTLTEFGAKLLDPTGDLKKGIKMAPPEGDAATGMIATNSIRPNTGNISLGTSSFLMATLDKPLSKPYEIIDVVATPAGAFVAMLHSNNGSTELNDWVNMFYEYNKLINPNAEIGDVFVKLFENSLNANPDCDGVITYNFLANEPIANVNNATPLVVKTSGAKLDLKNLIRSELYATVAPISLGMDILRKENIKLDVLNAHGGLFKTQGVMQRYLSAAINTKVSVSKEASYGGAFGMAVLASYLDHNDIKLEDYLDNIVFKNKKSEPIMATLEEVNGYNKYLETYKKYLYLEQK